MLYTIITIILLVIMLIGMVSYLENYYVHEINRRFNIIVDEYEEIQKKTMILKEESKKFITSVKKL